MPDRPSWVRPIALTASVALAVSLATCARESAGPPRHAAFSVAPVLPSGTSLAAFNLSVDNVRLIVVRPPADTVFDQTVAFPANQSSLPISADIPLERSPETFQVTIQLLSGTTLLFAGTQNVSVTADQVTPPAQIPVTYSGPGQNVASLIIDPPDSVLTQGGTLQFRLTAKDAQGVIVPTFYASWTTSDTNVAKVDATGVLTAPFTRTTVSVLAHTPNNVSASTPITFTPVATAISIVSGCNQGAPPGGQLPQPVVVRVIAGDQLGVKGVAVQFTAPPGGGVVPTQAVTDANGLAQTAVTLGATPGPTSLSINAGGLAPVTCNQTVRTLATKLAITAQPTGGVTAGALFTVVVTAQDALGNTDVSFAGNVTLALGANPGGSAFGSRTIAAVAGVAAFGSVALDKAGNGYTLVATSGVLTPATSTPFNVIPAAPAQLVYSVQPTNVGAGSPITPAVVVAAQDPFGNPTPSFVGSVTVALGVNPGGATLGGTLSHTAVGGAATFADLTIDKVGLGYTLVASSSGLSNATSTSFNVITVPSTHLAFTTQPSNVSAGSAIAPAVQITAMDGGGNVVTSFTGAITVALGNNPGGGVLSGTLTMNAVAGVAAFADLSIDKAGSGYTLVATASGLTAATSVAFNVTAGAATHFVVSVSPGSVTAGIAASVTVTAQDGAGNTAAGYRGTVHFTSSDAQATLPADYAFVAGDNGIHTFANGVTLKTAGSQSVTATDIASSSITGSGSSTVAAAAAASVVKISGDNQSGAGGAPLAQPLVVEVRDAFTNPVANATVTWATADGGSLAPPSGPTASNGRAQSTWTLGSSVTSQSATATVGALTPATFSATATTSTPVISLSFAGVPGVGVGLAAKVYVDISQPAPAGGTAIAVVSGNTSFYTVAPGSVTIPQGKARDSVTVTGVAAGQADLTASATGYTSGVLTVVVQNRNISVPQNLNVPYGQTASLPIQLPAPAPAGGVTFDVVSSAPGNVGVATPQVTVPAGGQTVNATLNGVLPGPATITVSNPAYLDGTTNATTTASLNIVGTSATLNATFGTTITVNFESNGVPAAAPAPGISVTLTPTDSKCVAASSPVTIPTGLVSTTATLTYGGSTPLPCTTKLLAQATSLQPDSINVTVNPVPGITVGSVTVGSGLQINTSFTLGTANHGNINVTLTSSDPKVLLAPDATTPGQAQITIPVADGTQTVGFYVQGLEGRTTDTVKATVTVSASGFSDGTAIETAQQAAIDLQGLPASTTTLSASNFIFARTGIANASNTALNQLQAVRAGAPGPLTVTFTTPGQNGILLKAATAPATSQTALIAVGQSNSPTDTTSGGVAFRPLAAGVTTVDASVSGFIATTAATRTISVTQPGITVGAVTVGSGLQINTSFTLGAPNHGNIDVTLTSSDPKVLLAPNATTPGQAQITIPVLDGTQTVGFYVQGLEGRTTDTVKATVTVSAPGFSDGTAIETAQQAAIDLQGVPASTTTLSASNFIFARTGIANAPNTALNQLQSVRAGAPGPLIVTFTIPSDGTGELLKQATAPGVTQTATIPIGQSNSPTDTTSGGVAFHPLQSGATTVSAAISGFIATSAASRPITVSAPGITVGSVTVGSGLQINTSFTLGAPNHGNINVTLTSSDPKVLLAPNATTAGQPQITIPVADGTQTVGFYVQGLEGRTTDTVKATVTVSAPGFNDGSAVETAQQAAIDLQGLPGSTTTLSPANALFARTGIANSLNSALNQLQSVRAGAPGPLTVTFTTPASGIGELLKKGNPAGVTQTATIPIGQSNSPTDTTSGGVAFHALLSGTTTVSAAIPGFIGTTAATRPVDVTQPGITVGSVTVGSGLQVNTSFTLGAPNHGNIDVTLTSSNPAILVSPNAGTAGQSQITIPVPDGTQTVGFYVQGLEGQTGTVTATVTVTASGFTNGTASETVVQGALDLQGLPTTTTPLTPSSPVFARVGIPNAQSTALNQLQAVRTGAPGPLTVTFTTPANGIGEVLKKATPAGLIQTATIPIGQSNSPTDTTSGGVAFHPLAGLGPTSVSATIPGFVATAAATRSVTNATPGISVGSLTVGSGLQINTSFTLGAPNHGNFSVTLTSSDPAILISPNATTAGQTQITIPVADGVQTVGFYVQGLEGLASTVSGTITVSAPAFTDGVASETVVQPALDLQGVPSTMPVGAADANLFVRVGTPSAGNGSLNQLQAVRAGLPGGALSVSVTSGNVNAATLVNSAGGTGSPQTVLIAAGQSNSPTTVAAGGVALRRVAAGTSSISAAATGVITTTNGTRSVTVQ